ncbi:flagellar assembly protein FliW [Deltaproteobacteria bacterium TL4]
MIIKTTRFGDVEINESEIITMPAGLLGFSSERLFVLIDDEVGSPFKWLQSVEKPTLAFVTIDPLVAVSNYSLALSSEHLKKLESSMIEELTVRVIVTMTRDLKDVTINLQGPLIINPYKKLGLQLVISDGVYSTRHPLFGDKLQVMTSSDQAQQNQTQTRKIAVG